jgi:hypothetical protein
MGYQYCCLLEGEVHHSVFFFFFRALKRFKKAYQRWLVIDAAGQRNGPIFKGKGV